MWTPVRSLVKHLTFPLMSNGSHGKNMQEPKPILKLLLDFSSLNKRKRKRIYRLHEYCQELQMKLTVIAL